MGIAKRLNADHHIKARRLHTFDVERPPKVARVWLDPAGAIQLGNATDRVEPTPRQVERGCIGPTPEELLARLQRRDLDRAGVGNP